jgi:hypothetical protein
LTAAGRAKTTFDQLARGADDSVIRRRPADLERGFRQRHNRSIRGAIRFLTVPTVTIHHNNCVYVAFVMDSAARASARDFLRHGDPSEIEGLKTTFRGFS